MDRIFTIDEARAALADNHTAITQFLERRADFAELRWALQHDREAAKGGVAELKALEAHLDAGLSGLRDLGVQIKGIAPLLLDFPAELDGRKVLLCWLEGESELEWYHRVELGLIGRRRL
ncbi:MAG: DUF2203 domain-containing protein [Actinobacteria bacterium]|nr:DUF2203 domain-containing protein [Actinomycetota bacterium]